MNAPSQCIVDSPELLCISPSLSSEKTLAEPGFIPEEDKSTNNHRARAWLIVLGVRYTGIEVQFIYDWLTSIIQGACNLFATWAFLRLL
jgi:hypothetical protein